MDRLKPILTRTPIYFTMEYMPTPAKKKPVAKRKPPKKPVQKKEEIEKHLKAINAALGIEETSPEAESIAQAAEQVETEEETTEAAHASDLLGTTETEKAVTPEPTPAEPVAEPVAPVTEKAEPVIEPQASVPASSMPGEGAISINPTTPVTPEASTTPAAPAVAAATETTAMPPMTDQPQMPGAPMGADGMVPPADGATDFGSSTGEGSKKKKVMIILLIVLVIVALGAGGLYFYNMMAAKQKASQSAAKKQSQAQFKPDATATPTEAALADLAEYSVQVLNGSGTPGQAGVVEGLLEDAGFTDITTGNADEYSYTDTEITLKKGAPQALYDAVEKALGSDYVVVQTAEELDAESDYDVQVIVGSDSPDEATPAEEDQ